MMMTKTTPEVRSVQLESLNNDEGSHTNVNMRCEINEDRRCVVHLCGARTIKISSGKWLLNKKTGLYGTKKVKVSKLICIARNGGVESPSKSSPTRTRVSKSKLVGRAIGLFENLECSNNCQKISESSER